MSHAHNTPTIANSTNVPSHSTANDRPTSATGSNWQSADGWLTNAPTCEWAYVECAGAGDAVTALSAGGNYLSGSIPTQIGGLKSLISVDLSNGNFPMASLPSEIGMLTDIEGPL